MSSPRLQYFRQMQNILRPKPQPHTRRVCHFQFQDHPQMLGRKKKSTKLRSIVLSIYRQYFRAVPP